MFYRASQAVQIHHGNILLMTNKQRKQPTSKGRGGKGGKKGEGERERRGRVCHGAPQTFTLSSAYA